MLLACKLCCRRVGFWEGHIYLSAQGFWCRFLAILTLVSETSFSSAVAAPWVGTEDSWLRADIERLSRVGLIDLPINSYPLMWSGIVEQLVATDLKNLQPSIVGAYFRVRNAGRQALEIDSTQHVQLSAKSRQLPTRHYGEQSRHSDELQFSQQGTGENFAYHLRFNKSEGHKLTYDHSYIATVVGNWAVMLGAIERWWGPGWNSSLILSNNARPTPGLSLQRNYTDPYTVPILELLGPWTAGAFVSELDDKRHIENAKLLGFTFGFKPVPDLEINLRRTMQWGGEGRPESFDSLTKLVLGNANNCDVEACGINEPGNQLAAMDISWQIPLINSTIYVQTVGEDEAGYISLKSSRQWGLKRDIESLGFSGSLFLESDNTTTQGYSSQHNILYNHTIYETGYRYRGRAIGATWDNDSKVTSVGFVGRLNNGDPVSLGYSAGKINIDSISGSPSEHSIAKNGGKISILSIKWRRGFSWGYTQLDGRYTLSLPDQYQQSDKLSFSAQLLFNL